MNSTPAAVSAQAEPVVDCAFSGSGMFAAKIEGFTGAADVAVAAADLIVRSCARVLGDKTAYSLVLSGGSTPTPVYELLASEKYRQQIDWRKVEVFFADERAVPPDHADSNYKMIH